MFSSSNEIAAPGPSNYTEDDNPNAGDEDIDQLPLYDFVLVLSATNNFSYANKIGEGGFGAVYKVCLCHITFTN